MRKTLIDKCEEVINNNDWPHGSSDLRTGKIFKDLLQFYGTIDQSIYSEPSVMAGAHDQTTLPQSNASFMPAISQRTLMQGSIDQDANSGGIIINNDMHGIDQYTRVNNSFQHPKSGSNKHRKHSHPANPQTHRAGGIGGDRGTESYMPMPKALQGSGATLNNPNLKRPLNNTVTIKAELGMRSVGD